jgi:manganese/zinc/iron transport system permease protein
MDSLFEFFLFNDPNIRYVVLGSVLLSAISAMVGTFTFLDKKSLMGDAIAHAILPGICLGFLISGTKNPWFLIAGAFVTGWLSIYAIEQITSKTRIKEDTAIGLILSVFFGIGVLMLTAIQKSGNAAQSGLDQFIFGKAAAMIGQDLLVFSVVAVFLLLSVWLLFKEFTLIAFDKDFAAAIGMNVRKIRMILTSLVVLAVVIGIQAVGVVLMAAMLITPAAAARFWTDKIKIMIIIASLFGAVSGLSGAYISWLAPAMPTGPWIVVVISSIAILSFFIAPRRGIIARMWKQKMNRRTINEENLLKALYQLGEEEKDFFHGRTATEIQLKRKMDSVQLASIMRRLRRQGYIQLKQSRYFLTGEGLTRGQRIVKLHRLWELYLTTKLNIAPDHVHDDADTMEHLITPELEQELEKQLGFPQKDPHASEIPYA